MQTLQQTSSKHLIAGVDEAGRGPLAGPVIAAAVILDPARPIEGLADSKQLSEKQRERLFQEIRHRALAWSAARATVIEIDRINILQASLLAMQRAVQRLLVAPSIALIDGNKCPVLSCPSQAIVKGDELEPAISAASIVAKVLRDRIMLMLDKKYPCYGFAKHKGYPTAMHVKALQCHGSSRVHRRSFAPVTLVLQREEGPRYLEP
ncbi:MAG: ribonuclease HII [Gammaproteobacteria bacterium]|nr:ribonuclease HII [Gammaproteobacteria bacterium]MCW5582920.1 ribonuclease HII [Gammaproteobacteria bacterium]